MIFIAFDLETTGPPPVTSQIVEIGAIRFQGDGTILGEFEQLVDPQCHMPEEVTKIHGITDQMVINQPTIEEVFPNFIKFLGDPSDVMLAHNASFDMDILAMAFS